MNLNDQMIGRANNSNDAKAVPKEERRPHSIRELKLQKCMFFRQQICPWAVRMPQATGCLPRRNSPGDFIFIPAQVRGWEISRFETSSRLGNALGNMNCRVLGDLHGLRLSDIGRWRNVGKRTVRELIQLVRSLQEGDWCHWSDPNAAGAEDYWEI